MLKKSLLRLAPNPRFYKIITNATHLVPFFDSSLAIAPTLGKVWFFASPAFVGLG
jgi:hypothetical protein